MGAESNRNYWLLSGCFFSFFLAWSFSYSLFPLWLNQSVGLKGEATGLIFSVNAIAALFIMPCYGYFQDKLGLRKNVLYLVAALLILCGPFFVYVYGPLLKTNIILGAIVGGVYAGMATLAGVGALETYIERVGRTIGFEWGKARMWGSLGWAAATFCAGFLFNINPDINFWCASISAMIFIALLIAVRPGVANASAVGVNSASNSLKLDDAFALLRMRKFWALATFVMGVSCIYSVYDQQFPIYFASLFETQERGNAMFGYLNSFQVFLEAGGMFLAPFLVNKIGAKHGLVLSGIIMATRMIGSGFADGLIEISFMKLLHAVELPIMLVSLFKYIAANFDARLSATIYLVGFQFMSQVMASVLSILAGMMYDQIGFAMSYKILGGIVAFFVVVSHFVLSQDTEDISSTEASEQPHNIG